MVVKINEHNAEAYGAFLAEAYRHLEKLEWRRAYQYLLILESTKGKIIEDVDLDTTNEEDQYKTFSSLRQFLKYISYYENNFNVRIIRDEDLSLTEERFYTIEQYYNYIEEFINGDYGDHFLMRLPLDETNFSIDGNTRVITIPKDYVSTVIQRDTMVETIIFTIDRFIDSIDLANASRIFVQWDAPDKDSGETRHKATEITLTELFDSQIKFGWPIDDNVTKYPGTVTFSVTFFEYEDNSTEQVKWRINTLPASLTVEPALQPEITGIEVVKPTGTFYRAIKNNRYPGIGGHIPVDPDFEYPGKNLEDNDPSESGILSFEAQAVVSDEGQIEYSWWHQPEGCEKAYNCAGGQYVQLIDRDGAIISDADYNFLPATSQQLFTNSSPHTLINQKDTFVEYGPFGTIYETYRPLEENEEKEKRDILYVYNGKEENAPQPDEGKDRIFITDENNNFIYYSSLDDSHQNKQKYEKFTMFTMPEDKTVPIVGKYHVEAVNKLPAKDVVTGQFRPNASKAICSEICSVNGPDPLEFTKEGGLDDVIFIRSLREDIAEGQVLTEKEYLDTLELIEFQADKEKFIESFQVTEDKDTKEINYTCNTKGKSWTPGIKGLKLKKLVFTPEIERETSQGLTYTWYTGPSSGSLIQDTKNKTSTITVTEPTWCKVKIQDNKNRKTNEVISRISRITTYPREVFLDLDTDTVTKYQAWEDGEKGLTYQIDIDKNQTVAIGIKPMLRLKKNGEAFTKEEYDFLIYPEREAVKVNNKEDLEKEAEDFVLCVIPNVDSEYDLYAKFNETINFIDTTKIDLSLIDVKTLSISGVGSVPNVDAAQNNVLYSVYDSSAKNYSIYVKADSKNIILVGKTLKNLVDVDNPIESKDLVKEFFNLLYPNVVDDELYSSKINYKWTKQVKDGDEVTVIATELVGPTSNFDEEHTAIIKVKGDIKVPCTYRCIATNQIGEELSAVSNTATFLVG